MFRRQHGTRTATLKYMFSSIRLNSYLAVILFIISAQSVVLAQEQCKAAFEVEFTLAHDAQELGLTPKVMPITFRFDARPPNEIKNARGFYPNQDKPQGSLLMHVNPNSHGTSNYVSLTLESGNNLVIRSAGVTPEHQGRREFSTKENEISYRDLYSAKKIKENKLRLVEIEKTLDKILIGRKTSAGQIDYTKEFFLIDALPENKKLEVYVLKNEQELLSDMLSEVDQNNHKNPMVYTVYEYEIRNAYGVEINGSGIVEEKEFTVEAISYNQIIRYREVEIVLNYSGPHSPTWNLIADKKVDSQYFRSFWVDHLRDSASNTVYYGDWKELF